MALYVAGARFNHSCEPLATVQSSKQSLTVKARVDVPEGSEVTISYLPPQLLVEPGGQRRQRLLAGRGFECRCVRCLAGD